MAFLGLKIADPGPGPGGLRKNVPKTLVFVWFCALDGKNIVRFWPREAETAIGVADFAQGMTEKTELQQKGRRRM